MPTLARATGRLGSLAAAGVTVNGTARSDRLVGGDGDDYINGRAGDDILEGRGGDDVISGGDGIDTLYGGDGRDYAYGEVGDDVIYGQGGDDSLGGGAGHDELYGGDGNDFLGAYYRRVPDIDTVADLLSGGAGDDQIRAGWGDTVYGGAGFDVLQLDFSLAPEAIIADFALLTSGVSINFGDATINGIEQVYSIYLSGFDDFITTGMNTSSTVVAGLAGNDNITGNNAFDYFYGGFGNDILKGYDGGDYIQGDTGNDRIYGGGGNDELIGGSGSDLLNGGLGDDILGRGYKEYQPPQAPDPYYWIEDIDTNADILIGGGGDDLIFAGAGDSVDGGDGIDTLHVNFRSATQGVIADFSKLTSGEEIEINGVSYRNIEQITVAVQLDYSYAGVELSPFDDRFIAGRYEPSAYRAEINGADGNDFIAGSIYEELIEGGNGNDRVIGGGGEDYLIGGDGDDILIGGSDDDWLGGNDGQDRIIGGAGDDSVYGGSDDDVLFGDDGADELNGQSGKDRLHGGAGDDRLSGEDGDDRLVGDDGADQLLGGIGADVLLGGEGVDRLDGQDGADRLDGGGGDDILTVDAYRGDGETLIGGTGADRFVIGVAPVERYSPAMPTLRILDFSRAEGDVIDVSGAIGTFAFIGTDAFHNVRNEIRYAVANGQTVIQFDADGNGQTDLTIRLTQEIALVAADFAL